MSEFITLICPSCGGKLEVTQGTQSLICKHCGSEHFVKRDAGTVLLESYARCPLCKRNDRVEKVSVVYSKQDTLSNRVAPFKNPVDTIKYILYSKSKSIPKTTKKQIEKKFTNTDLKVAKILLICSLICLFAGIPLAATIIPLGVLLLLLFIIGLILYLIFLIKGKIKEKKQKKQTFAELTQTYNNAMKRYRLLYYCLRDDVVFIPGENIAFPPTKLKDLCYKQTNE